MKKEWIVFISTWIGGFLLFMYSIFNEVIDSGWAIGVCLGILLGVYTVYLFRIINSIIGVKDKNESNNRN